MYINPMDFPVPVSYITDLSVVVVADQIPICQQSFNGPYQDSKRYQKRIKLIFFNNFSLNFSFVIIKGLLIS